MTPRHDDYPASWSCDSKELLDELLLVGHVLTALHGPGYAYRREGRRGEERSGEERRGEERTGEERGGITKYKGIRQTKRRNVKS